MSEYICLEDRLILEEKLFVYLLQRDYVNG